MNALALFEDIPTDDLSPAPLFYVEPTDRDKASELQRVGLLRSRARMVCPAVKLVAVPNAGNRGQKALNQAVKEGAAWGFPDLLAIAPGKVAFLEMKDGTGKASAHQIDWLNRLHLMGFPCGVFRTADRALAFLRWHGFPFSGGAS